MSKFIRAITDMISSYQDNSRKGRESERFQRCEFKKLVQQDLPPAKTSSVSRPKRPANTLSCDTEPMNQEGLISAEPCMY